jgi:prepilin peptidase CpaA
MLSFLVPVLAAAFAGLVLAGAFRDLVSYTIPNWISLAIIGLFPVAALATGLSLPTVGLHLGIGVAVLVAAMAMFAFGWIGGGDAKMFAAAALWMGWPAVVDFVLGTAITGGVLAMALLSLRSSLLRPAVLLGPSWLVRLSEPGGAAPYGVAIAVGGLMALPQSPLLSGLAL